MKRVAYRHWIAVQIVVDAIHEMGPRKFFEIALLVGVAFLWIAWRKISIPTRRP
jgi:hypothetical protein